MSCTKEKWIQFIRVVIDLVIFITAFAIVILLSVDKLHIFKPFERGFYCDDRELRYPHKIETVDGTAIIMLAVFVLPIIMVIIEWFCACRSDGICCCIEGSCCNFIKRLYKTIGWYLLGGTFTLLTVEICKASVGRLRPHFFEVCKPNWTDINCTEDFITEYNCTNEDEEELIAVRKSFPSGHAAASCYEALYLVIYLQVRVYQRTEWARAICPLVQTLAIGGAIFISMSRVQDYHHFATDVLGGAFVGICGCIVTILFYSDLAKEYVLPCQIEKDKTAADLHSVKSEKPQTYDNIDYKNGLQTHKDVGHENKGFARGNGEETDIEKGYDNEGFTPGDGTVSIIDTGGTKITEESDTLQHTELGVNFETKKVTDEEAAPTEDGSDNCKMIKADVEENDAEKSEKSQSKDISTISSSTKM